MVTLTNLAPPKSAGRDSHEESDGEQLSLNGMPPFQELIENSSDGTALLNLDGTVLYANPSTARVIGNPEGSLIGRTIFDLLHPEDVRQALESFEEVLEAPGNIRTTEMRCKRQGGTWAWIESTTTNLASNPNVRAVVATYRDIDGRKRAEEK